MYIIDAEEITDEVVRTVTVIAPFTLHEEARLTETLEGVVFDALDAKADLMMSPGKYELKLILVVTENNEV